MRLIQIYPSLAGIWERLRGLYPLLIDKQQSEPNLLVFRLEIWSDSEFVQFLSLKILEAPKVRLFASGIYICVIFFPLHQKEPILL